MLDRPLNDRPVSIRWTDEDPDRALSRVAALDSQHLPRGPWLVAELDRSPVAVLSLSTGSFVADPFCRTIELRALLELRAGQLRAAEERRGPEEPRRPRRARWLSAAPAGPSSSRLS